MIEVPIVVFVIGCFCFGWTAADIIGMYTWRD